MRKIITLFLMVSVSLITCKFANAQSLLVSGGSGSGYTVNYPANTGASIPAGFMFTFRAHVVNVATCSLAVNGAPPAIIKKNGSFNLEAGDITAGSFVTVIYDGTNWQMLSVNSNPSSGSVWNTTGSDIYNNNAGNVGIGTTVPQAPLHIYKNAFAGILLDQDGTNTLSQVDFDMATMGTGTLPLANASTKGWRFSAYSNAHSNTSLQNDLRLNFYNGIIASPGLYFEAASGNVGIYTTSAINRLDVGGNMAIGINYAGNSTAPSNGLIVEGSVGIGTDTPGSALHVNGGVTFSSLVGPGLVHVNGSGVLSVASGSYVTSGASAGYIPRMASSIAMLNSPIQTDGSWTSIGIAPSNNYLFRVEQTTSAFPAIYGQNSFTDGSAIWGYSSNNSINASGVRAVATGQGRAVYADNSDATGYSLYATGRGYFGGNVGIGTVAPGTIAGASKYLTIAHGQAFSGSAYSSLEMVGSRNVANSEYSRLDFINFNTPVPTITNSARISAFTGNSVIGHGQIVFFTNNGTLTEKMRLSEAGRLGIGVINPSLNAAQLQISDLANTVGQIRLWAGTATGETGTDGLLINMGSTNASIQNYEGGSLQFGTGGSAILATLLPSGNLGLKTGVSAPGSKLSVDGGVSIGTNYFSSLAPTNGIIIEGKSGIGTNAPDNTFQATIENIVNAANENGLKINTANISSTTKILDVLGDATPRFTVFGDGKVVVPTGGSLKVAGDVSGKGLLISSFYSTSTNAQPGNGIFAVIPFSAAAPITQFPIYIPLGTNNIRLRIVMRNATNAYTALQIRVNVSGTISSVWNVGNVTANTVYNSPDITLSGFTPGWTNFQIEWQQTGTVAGNANYFGMVMYQD